jgi:hypothetical protein
MYNLHSYVNVHYPVWDGNLDSSLLSLLALICSSRRELRLVRCEVHRQQLGARDWAATIGRRNRCTVHRHVMLQQLL